MLLFVSVLSNEKAVGPYRVDRRQTGLGAIASAVFLLQI